MSSLNQSVRAFVESLGAETPAPGGGAAAAVAAAMGVALVRMALRISLRHADAGRPAGQDALARLQDSAAELLVMADRDTKECRLHLMGRVHEEIPRTCARQ